MRWVAPTDLYVDETYQRDLSRKSAGLIRNLITNFAWNRMKPPVVVDDAGVLHVVDGQHTAIAAATIGLKEIPIFVVEAPTIDERARAFVGHNTDRITVAPLQIHQALLASKDPDALDVDRVCRRAGVRVRQLNQGSAVAEGDTMALGTIRKLIARRGVQRARIALECLVKARRAPLVAGEILAVEMILFGQDKPPSSETLTRAIRIEGDAGLASARGKASRDRSPIWRAIMERYLARIERGRG